MKEGRGREIKQWRISDMGREWREGGCRRELREWGMNQQGKKVKRSRVGKLREWKTSGQWRRMTYCVEEGKGATMSLQYVW